jgi:hypothetical protein
MSCYQYKPCLQSLHKIMTIYLYLYPKFNKCFGEFFIIHLITFVLFRLRESWFAGNHLLIRERTFFDGMEKLSKLLKEIMTLVSSANLMIICEVFSVGGSHLYRLWKAKALKLTPGELLASKGNMRTKLVSLEFSRESYEACSSVEVCSV